uniref:Rap-GAP domain-containing protein n=1 Tax=Glossina brevipalpis TaxID=37001 RepID=A0A1A9W2Z0_9MUSC
MNALDLKLYPSCCTTIPLSMPALQMRRHLKLNGKYFVNLTDEFCEEYPHNLMPTPGYWIECSRQKITLPSTHTIWDESDSEHEDMRGASSNEAHMDRECNDLYEDDEDSEATPSPRKKTTIEEQWEQNGCFELISVEQETYEKYFYSTEHWNYFTSDEDLGPVILSIKQETLNGRDQFRILVRAGSYTVHGLIPASCVFADRYNREEVVRSLGKEVNLNPPLTLGQLPDTPEELLKLDQVFIKSELKVGVIYVKEDQYTEEQILDNNENSLLFDEFLTLLGDRVRLKGFDKYKGGLDTVHDLTGLYSVYTNWRSIEIMFHVSTLLPYEKHDPQKLQRKRHIGNDIVCVVFLEADNTKFSPACIKSHFLHTFILVRVSARIKHKPTRYEVSVVTRDEVGAYKPYLWEQSVFEKGPMFREWLLTKIVNGERASYSAPKFARMQERTRSQMLEDLVMNLSNHAETGQIPKPYRRGSWRPIGEDEYRKMLHARVLVTMATPPPLTPSSSATDVEGCCGRSYIQHRHMRPSSPLLDSVRDQFEDYDQLAKDFTRVFLNEEPSCLQNSHLFDVVFLVGQSKQKARFIGVRAILGVRNRDSKEKDKDKATANQLAVPRLSVCADAQKVDRAKLAQTEFTIIEFDPDTFRVLLDYLHTGTCPLTCVSIPGLLCAAEHYDLPELLQACFHHCKQFMRIEVCCPMLITLENYYWRYTSASELVNMILSFVENKAHALFKCSEFLNISESMVQMIMCRELQCPEIRKFEAMLAWAKHKVAKMKNHPSKDTQFEFECIMDRLTRDLNLCRISPSELLSIVLPSKALKNERIMETLMMQVNLGTYRMQELDEYRQQLRSQDSTEATVQVHRGG